MTKLSPKTSKPGQLIRLFSLVFAVLVAACGSKPVAEPQEAGETAGPAELPGSPVFTRTGAAPMIDLAGVQKTIAGDPTRVLVLGSRHFSYLSEEEFDPANLSLVLDRLEAFAPDIIAIEAVGGRACDEIQRYEPLYPGAQQYCTNGDDALNALDMTRPEAAAATEELLAGWPDTPTVSDRRRLALLFFGAGEPWSAYLQWSLLEEQDRIAADGLTDEMVGRLNRVFSSRNENRMIGIELATRLGIQKLAAIDDHTADIIQTRAPETFSPVLQSVWATVHPREEEFAEWRNLTPATPEAFLEDFLFINSEELQRYTIEEDFGQATAMPDEGAVARQYVAWWQARGLRMAANVIVAAGNHPGARVLVVTGSSHKAYFDAYLDQMHDVELVSVEEVLSKP